MEKKKFAKAPLLYIDQPTVTNPEAEMQHQYRSKRKKKKSMKHGAVKEEEVDTVTYNSFRPSQEENPSESEAEYTEEAAIQHDEETIKVKKQDTKSESSVKRKPFKEMSIEEKVRYFVNSSSYAPKVKCEVKTESRRYRGVIADFKDNDVILQIGARAFNKSVPFEEIKDIRIIGF